VRQSPEGAPAPIKAQRARAGPRTKKPQQRNALTKRDPTKKETKMKDNPIIKIVNFHVIDYPTPSNLNYW